MCAKKIIYNLRKLEVMLLIVYYLLQRVIVSGIHGVHAHK